MRDPLAVMRSQPTIVILEDGPHSGRTVLCDEVGGYLRVAVEPRFAEADEDGIPITYGARYEPVLDDSGYPSRTDDGIVRYHLTKEP